MEQDTLFKYLDAKFEGVANRIDGLQKLWENETMVCSDERKALLIRTEKLENWRAYLTGGISVVALLATGVLGWLFRVVGSALLIGK
jgi:hypothetical protein